MHAGLPSPARELMERHYHADNSANRVPVAAAIVPKIHYKPPTVCVHDLSCGDRELKLVYPTFRALFEHYSGGIIRAVWHTQLFAELVPKSVCGHVTR
jgi:hypothetical protein